MNNQAYGTTLDINLILDAGFMETERFLNLAKKFANDSRISTNQLRDLYELILGLGKEKTETKRQIAKILIKLEYSFRRNSIPKKFYSESRGFLGKEE